MEYKVALTRRADQDLVQIWNFIAKDNPAAATSFCLELTRNAHALKDYPDRAAKIFSRPSVRKIPCKNYLIYYRINNTTRTVEILRFWHAARDQNRLRLKEAAAQPYQPAKVQA